MGKSGKLGKHVKIEFVCRVQGLLIGNTTKLHVLQPPAFVYVLLSSCKLVDHMLQIKWNSVVVLLPELYMCAMIGPQRSSSPRPFLASLDLATACYTGSGYLGIL